MGKENMQPSIIIKSLVLFLGITSGFCAAENSFMCATNDTNIPELQEARKIKASAPRCIILKANLDMLIKFSTKTDALCKFEQQVPDNSIISTEFNRHYCFEPDSNNSGWLIKLKPTERTISTQYYAESNTKLASVIVSNVAGITPSWLPVTKFSPVLQRNGNPFKLKLAQGFQWYVKPEISNITFNDSQSVPYSLSIFEEGLVITPTSDSIEGKLKFSVKNDFQEQDLVEIDITTKEPYQDKPSVLALRIELSLAKKLIADERFLTGGELSPSKKKSVYEKYEEAKRILPQCKSKSGLPPKDNCLELTNAQKATIKLIEADINYREILLDKNYPFYGGYRSLKQTTPHHELLKLIDLLKEMNRMSDRMDKFQFRATDMALKAIDISSERAYVMGQIQSENILATKAEISSTNFDASIQRNLQRKDYIKQYISELNERAQQLSSEQDSLNASAGALIQQGIAAASGLPVNEVKALAEGNLDQAVKTYVAKQLSDSASEYAKDIIKNSELTKSFSESVTKFTEARKDLEQMVSDAHEYKKKAEELNRTLNTSIDEIRDVAALSQIDLGKKIFDGLDKAAQSEIDKIVDQYKPINTLIESAYNEIAKTNYIPSRVLEFEASILELSKIIEIEDKKIDEIRDRLLKNFDLPMRPEAIRLLSDQIGIVAADRITLIKMWPSIIELYPNILSTKIMQEVLKSVKESERANFRKALISFDDNIRGTNPILSSDDQRVIIRISSSKNVAIDPKQLMAELRLQVPIHSQEAISSVIKREANSLNGQLLIALNICADGPELVAKNFNSLVTDIKPKEKSKVIEEGWEKLKSTELFNAPGVVSGPRALIASVISQPTPTQVANSNTQPRTKNTSNSGIDPNTNLAVTAALNYAFPGAGIALQLGQAYASMGANRDLLQQIERDTVNALVEYASLQQVIEQANINSVIAQKDKERANALAEASKAQLEQFNSALDIALTDAKEAETRLKLYRPYFFFIAEMLRERLDLFDRSLSLWSTGKPESGFFSKQIQNDPSKTRLALDSEIHLFDWLNRDREATKTDPYQLVIHWQQLVQLAEQYCSDYGCKPGDDKLGKLGTTSPTLLFGKLTDSSTKDKFETWRKSNNRKAGFTFPLTISSAQKLTGNTFLNVRLVDVNIVPISKSGAPIKGSTIKISHTGFSKIGYLDPNENTVKSINEQLLPASTLALNNEQPFNLLDLRNRFQSQGNTTNLLAPRPLEGYGFYGNYEFTIMDSNQIQNIEDFNIEFAYIFQEREDIRTEADIISVLPESKSCNDKLEKLNNSTTDQSTVRFCSPVISVKTLKSVNGTDKMSTSKISNLDSLEILSEVKSALQKNNESGLADLGRWITFDINTQMMTTKDVEEIRKLKPKCSTREILLNSKPDQKSKCFGDVK